ncbi:dihydrofolate reductase family protein [Actomonas aquatica]|uniref:Dihydrofolate reductase family protein n=1 Tax=Actomonas aquatica TaxID=2866162 RepID=A0ABZ1CC48_9BACT|nr:dihydrofolate reductase family protein [Opitutus sp. WL0086]WRQ89247.1 dihydrofolate reductase family protein [Opitutus sp. WL0086]
MRTVLIVAQSLDGFITRHDDAGTAWASSADQAWFRSCLPRFDALVMGRTTYETVRDVILAKRDDGVHRLIMTRSPEAWKDDAAPGALDFTAAIAAEVHASVVAAGRSNFAVLGGAHVHDLFLAAGLVDEIWVTIEPRIFGAGTPLVQARHDVKLTLLEQTRLDDSDSVVLRYAVSR